MYTPEGDVYRLWECELDPEGAYAHRVHDHVVELAQRNLPYEELKEQIISFVDEQEREVRAGNVDRTLLSSSTPS